LGRNQANRPRQHPALICDAELFPSKEALIEQIGKDIAQIRATLPGHH